jgi:hypothetical protein
MATTGFIFDRPDGQFDGATPETFKNLLWGVPDAER